MQYRQGVAGIEYQYQNSFLTAYPEEVLVKHTSQSYHVLVHKLVRGTYLHIVLAKTTPRRPARFSHSYVLPYTAVV